MSAKLGAISAGSVLQMALRANTNRRQQQSQAKSSLWGRPELHLTGVRGREEATDFGSIVDCGRTVGVRRGD